MRRWLWLALAVVALAGGGMAIYVVATPTQAPVVAEPLTPQSDCPPGEKCLGGMKIDKPAPPRDTRRTSKDF